MLHRVSKKDDVNAGKWIGVGGKLEKDEAPEECLLREVREETGLTLSDYRYRGLLTFIYNDREPEYIFIYTAGTESTDLLPCDEGELRWVEEKDVLGLELWDGDRPMMKYLLEGRKRPFSLRLRYHGDTLAGFEELLG